MSTALCEMCEQKVSEPCYSCISLSAPPSAFLGQQHPPRILPSQEEQDPTSLLSRPVASQIHPGALGPLDVHTSTWSYYRALESGNQISLQ